jgi:hypothetical protein
MTAENQNGGKVQFLTEKSTETYRTNFELLDTLDAVC